jgi:alkaline phosphatase D
VQLCAIVVRPEGVAPPCIEVEGRAVDPHRILRADGVDVHRYALSLPMREATSSFTCDGETFEVACNYAADLRIAFAACNGKEEGDLSRRSDERNAMWRRLGKAHARSPFQLILQGGDQIYADEVTHAHPLSQGWPSDVAPTLSAEQRAELAETLRVGFLRRYMTTFSQPEYAWLAARVPTLAMWDDHDICDGWGSLPEDVTRSEVGRTLFAAAREMFLVFQLGEAPGALPSYAFDRSGTTLTWAVDLPGVRLVAPDLRSERTRERIMGESGWRALEAAMQHPPERLLLLSSVPALGPRLSVVERIMERTPWAEKYEDDLRDQWQSRAHREEWCRFLAHLVDLQEGNTEVTVVSGEIHLATRGTMKTKGGPVHQLVASGISHPPPPRGYALALGSLARLGEGPLRNHPIRLRALPGRRSIYVAERNYLVLERRGRDWFATWELEEAGRTPPLGI